MRRNCLIPAVLVFVLVAGACGGDEDSTPSSPEDDRPDFASPETPSQDDISDESQDSARDAILSQPVVLLGNRFGWCSDVEDVWATNEAALATLLTVEANYEEALDAYETTTDELDRAEAWPAVADLGRSHNERLGEAHDALIEAVRQLRDARRAQGGQPEDIAYMRAWEALLAADPDLAGLSAAVGFRSSGSTSIAVPTTTAAPVDYYAENQGAIDFILELAVEYLPGQKFREGAAVDAAFAVYSQAGSAAVAESLYAALPAAVEAVGEVRTVGPDRLPELGYAAISVLMPVGGAVLRPYDAEAYDAAFSIAPGDPHLGSYYVDFARTPDELVAPNGEAFWSAYTARAAAIEAALPAAIELVQATAARLEAEEQAEAQRQREEDAREKAAEEALQAALEELASGSDAYTAFKRSFEESCR